MHQLNSVRRCCVILARHTRITMLQGICSEPSIACNSHPLFQLTYFRKKQSTDTCIDYIHWVHNFVPNQS